VLFPVPRQHVCLLIIFHLYLFDMNIVFAFFSICEMEDLNRVGMEIYLWF
jgi:hypothetical protein